MYNFVIIYSYKKIGLYIFFIKKLDYIYTYYINKKYSSILNLSILNFKMR